MPMLDIYVPEGALTAEVEDGLVAQLTDLLLVHEGADPGNAEAQSIAWVWVHRPARVFVGGKPTDRPRYKVVPQVPEGQYDDQRRASMIAALTEAVLDAEERMGRSRDPFVVWAFPTEIPEGTWGGGGRVFRLADIAALVLGSAEQGRAYAEQRLGLRTTATVVGGA
jgi:phenylpyruvate tautomerase PptA (4-oxalocrotonate tautomerase family)